MEGIRRTGTQLATKFSTEKAAASPQLFLFNELPAPDTNDDDTPSDEETLDSLPKDDQSQDGKNGGSLKTRSIKEFNASDDDAREDTLVCAPIDVGAADKDATFDGVSRDNRNSTTTLNGDATILNGNHKSQETSGGSSCNEQQSDASILSLLEQCLQDNPVSALTNHYMLKGFAKGLSNSFQHVQCDVAGKPNPYWRVEFTCPISNKVYCSCLPSTTPSPAMTEATKRAFGEFEIMNDTGQVVFLTKKGAKRSAAFAALHGVCNLTSATLRISPRSQRHPYRRHYPTWVQDLHGMGIKASTLSITYQQEACNDEWNCQPTLLCCVLKMESPNDDKSITIIRGSPQATKHLALKSAVSQAAKELVPKLDAAIANKSTNDTIDDDACEAMERLLSCNATTDASYAVTVPEWANTSIPSEQDTDVVLYVYELEFVTESGESFVKEQTGMDERLAGPLGIAFPMDVQPLVNHDFVYETDDVLLPFNNGAGTKRLTVRLRKRFVTSAKELSTGDVSFFTRMDWMKEFNRNLSHFKTYGQNAVSLIRKKMDRPKQEEEVPSPSDRSYLFVPLMRGEDGTAAIDWSLLERVATYKFRPYIDDRWTLPLGCLLLLATFVFVAPWIFCVGNERLVVDAWTLARGFGTLLVGLLLTKVVRITVPPEVVMNHFLVHARTSVNVYTARPDLEAAPSMVARLFATTRRGFRIPCQIVTAHSDYDFLLIQDKSANADDTCFVFSRGLVLLPMARHYLYISRLSGTFMPRIEREIELAFASVALQGLSTEQVDTSAASTFSLALLLKEASTLAPLPTYQRLEFLGDAVLGFYVSLIIMAGDSSLHLNEDAITTGFTESTKNDALYDAALRVGANRLLFSSQRAHKWRSEYSGKRFLTNLIMSRHEQIADRTMSDAVESLLGAAYIHDVSDSSDATSSRSVSVTVFAKLQLPVSSRYASADQVGELLSCCLNDGYPFEKDAAWQLQLDALAETFRSEHEKLKELDDKLLLLRSILSEYADEDWLCSTFENETSRILLRSAICHDDDSEDDYEQGDKEVPVEGMLRLERFREILSMVGAYALQLCVTADLFERYPDANEHELHILRARAITDDVLVYVMFKAGIHKAIYRMDPAVIEKFEMKMAEADFHGNEVWKACDGWVLPGGEEEFARRRKRAPFTCPQYPGYAGGRLCGTSKKLNEKYTDQPMYVMKAILGALVLASGIERMYDCIAPLFEEVMLLSCDESLRVYKDSNVK